MGIARALKKALKPEVDGELWDEGLFRPGEYTLESLLAHSNEFDGALVVATADDRVISRATSKLTPRDNLLLEYGLLVAVFGRQRALLMVEAGKNLKLPTDVAGLTYVPFRRTKKPKAGVRDAATAIKMVARGWAAESTLDVQGIERVKALLELLIAELRIRSRIESDFGLHVFLVDRRYDPPQLVRVARQRLSAKSRRERLFAFGEGIVGTSWRDEESVLVDFTSEELQAMSEAEWTTEHQEKFGMDWTLFDQSRKRYKAVGAVPISGIRPGTGFVGCIAYNLGWESEASVSSLQQPAVVQMLGLCAEGVAAVLSYY